MIEQGSLFYIDKRPDVYYYFASIKDDLLIYASTPYGEDIEVSTFSNNKFQEQLKDESITKIKDDELISKSNKKIIKSLFTGWLL